MATSTYEQVLTQLSPYVGLQMARAILNSHCQAIGLSPGELSTRDLEPLMSRLQTALKAFLGGTRANLVAASLARLH